MSRELPILFNTEMVRAVLDGRKTVTRRIVRGKVVLNQSMEHKVCFYSNRVRKDRGIEIKSTKYFTLESFAKYEALYHQSDILYVRETWNYAYDMDDRDQIIEETGRYIYYADDPMPFSHWVDKNTGEHKDKMPWRPSIHMPKEAARIWLKVTDVRAEKLRDITEEQAEKEGLYKGWTFPNLPMGSPAMTARQAFMWVWDSTIKKSDFSHYGWAANPWVWVIEFERC